MDVNKIRDLEQTYQKKIWSIVGSDKFRNALTNVENTMQNDIEIKKYYYKTNTTEILFERISRFFIYGSNSLNIINPFHSPISSDIAFETREAIIFIDCKTVDMNKAKNKGSRIDRHSILFNINQVTFQNINVYKGSAEWEDKTPFDDFEGVPYPNHSTLLTKDGFFKRQKPILTFILTLHYYPDDPDPESFRITDGTFEERQLNLACIPNFITAKKDFDNNIVTSFKTYEWVDKKGEYEKYPKYKSLKKQQSHFKKFRFLIDKGSGKIEKGRSLYFYDSKKKAPLGNINCVWGKIDGKYVALLHGKTARVRKTLFTENKNEQWRLNINHFS